MPVQILTRPGIHTSAVYIAFFMTMGVHLPFWTLWLGDWGLSSSQIGFLTAFGVAARVIAGIAVPALADRLDARRNTVAACALVAMLLFIGHLWIGSEALLLAATVGVGAAMAGIGPISEALGLAAARVHGFAYAHARGMGSLGFLLANLAGGALIARFGSGVALWWIVAGLTAVAILVLRHPGGGRVAGQLPPSLREIGALIMAPTFALFLATAALVQASHAVLYAYGSIHWRNLGLGEARIGALWAVSVATEIILMLSFGGWLVQRLGPVRALALAGAAGVVRWGGMMADPVGWTLWPLQGLHAATFALAHLGAMGFIARAVPPRYGAAAQGAMGAMAVGLGLSLGMVAAALVYPRLGGWTYGIGAGFSLASLVLCAALAQVWRGNSLAV